jgi:hypothetical protein
MKTILMTLIGLWSGLAVAMTCEPGSEDHKKFMEQQAWDEVVISSDKSTLDVIGKVDKVGRFHPLTDDQEAAFSPLQANLTFDESHEFYELFVEDCKNPDLAVAEMVKHIPGTGEPFKITLDFKWAPEIPAGIQYSWNQMELGYHNLYVKVSDDALVKTEFDVMTPIGGVLKHRYIRDQIFRQLEESPVTGSNSIDLTNFTAYACDLLHGRVSIQVNGAFYPKEKTLVRQRGWYDQEFVNSLYEAFSKASEMTLQEYQLAAGFLGRQKLLEIDPEKKINRRRAYAYSIFKQASDPSMYGTLPLNDDEELLCLHDQSQEYSLEFPKIQYTATLTFNKDQVLNQ